MEARITQGMDNYPLLFGSRWPAQDLEHAIATVEVDALCAEYVALRENAPRSSQSGNSYFLGHTGVASRTGASNRLEEHRAISLVNLGRRWPRPDGGWYQLLNYQVPLKAMRADIGVGKIDLLGVTDAGRLCHVLCYPELEFGSQEYTGHHRDHAFRHRGRSPIEVGKSLCSDFPEEIQFDGTSRVT